jgi:hypothetical protein
MLEAEIDFYTVFRHLDQVERSEAGRIQMRMTCLL